MLVPPQNPITRPKDPSSWKVITNCEFNGRAEDHFGKTSLHLSFTEYYVPLYQNASHGQDNQIFFLESVISVYDSGVWVGDVDILRALEDAQVHRMAILPCNHVDDVQYTTKMISAEGWDDILDPPPKKILSFGRVGIGLRGWQRQLFCRSLCRKKTALLSQFVRIAFAGAVTSSSNAIPILLTILLLFED
jgi:hypothetical protein